MPRQSATWEARPPAQAQRVTQLCAGAAFGIALLAEAGWLFHARFLAGQWGRCLPMAPTSALGWLLLSSGVFTYARWPEHRLSRRLALVLAGLPACLGLLVLVQQFTGVDLRVEWVLSRTNELAGHIPLGRMSPLTAGVLLLEGAALLLLLHAARWRFSAFGAALLALAATVIGVVISVGYAYGVPLLYGGAAIPVALPSALASVLVGAGQIGLAAPGVPALGAWRGDSIRGLLLRSFLPAVLAIILLEGGLDAIQWTVAPPNPALWHSLAAVVAGAVIVVLIGWTARRTGDAIDREGETLRASEERFRRMFEHSAAGMALVSPGFRFLQVNAAFRDMLGYTEAELLGRTFQDVTLPEDQPAGAKLTNRVLSGETEMFHFEKRYWRKDGTVVWGLVSATLIRDTRNKPLHFVAQIQDITERKRAEEALRESESRYRELFESSSDALFLIDTGTGRIVETNDMAATQYGYSRDELRAMKATDLSTEPDATLRCIQEARAEPGRVLTVPLRLHRRKDGTRFPVEATARSFARRERVLLLVSSRDITERKRAEEALRDSEERHRTVLQTAMDGFWLTDMQGRLLQVNDTYCRMTGYSMPELLRMAISDLEAAETAVETAVHVQEIMARGEDRFETRHRRKDGSAFEVEVSAQYWAIEGGRLVVFLRDITERKRAQETLRNSEMRLRAVLDATPFPIALVDAQDDHIEFWSRSALTLFGHTAPTAVEWYQLAYPDPQYRREVIDRWKPALENARQSGQAVDAGVYRVTCHDGSVRICELYAAFLADKLVVTFNDITSRERAEEEKGALQARLAQTQRMESVGRLAGGVAHDFNNLLTVINGYAAFLSEQLAVRDPRRGYALEIAKAGEHAASLTSQLLAFGRKQVIRPRAIDLNGVVADAERMLQRLIGEDIELVTTLAPRLGPVMADPDQIHQVIMNLAVNARDAMPHGGKLEIATAEVEVDTASAAAHADAAPGRSVRLTVTDTGIGMAEDVRRNIFEPFFTTKEPGQGTGLGLAMVYGIVRQNDGWIEVDSEYGRGSTFRVYLPRTDASVAADDEEPAAANVPRGDETVLIVEDQGSVRRLARMILVAQGYHVLEAANGADAHAVLRGHAGGIDLLLTDVVMPGMDGRTLSKQLRERYPNLPVILMSGYAEDVHAHRGALAGGVAYIQKPFRPDELAAKVREILDSGSITRDRRG
ncbi:MAG TPA: PAS domain S-box protein [Bryobacteraceae bacterium]|nr:PAS domain S-box protein [Bryobacteraceae bacterium]